jgi:uncharacterized protein YjbI with pentapeptide repeats
MLNSHGREADLDQILKDHAEYMQDPDRGRRADLTSADLRRRKFIGDLTGVVLNNADISFADFRFATVDPRDILSARGRFLAQFNPQILKALGLPEDHNQRAEERHFDGYDLAGENLDNLDLSGVSLRGAMLDKATFHETWLNGADLQETSLTGADLMTANQLHACQLRGADLTGAINGGAIIDHRTPRKRRFVAVQK